MHLGPEVQTPRIARELLLHYRVGNDWIDLDGRYIFAAGSDSPAYVPAAACADHQRLGAGPDVIGESRPLVQKLMPVGVTQVVEIEIRKTRGCVAVDHYFFNSADIPHTDA